MESADRLPIEAVLPALATALDAHNRCLLVAQPGAGKTTRVPLMLLQATPPGQRWLLLEPRRVAARLAAAFMAEQLGEPLGQTVGYRVRGDSRVCAATRLEVLTQGVLTRIMQDDPELSGVAGIIFDEFHERSLDADLGLALTLDIQQALRPDLKLLLMSATLDTSALLAVLGADTPLIDCPGRSWPVSTWYRPSPTLDSRRPEVHWAAVVAEALAAHAGDVLVFLPGQAEIRRLQQELGALAQRLALELCPLHGQMPLPAQQQVLRPAADGRRRVILSTAIAESSVTVPGVRIVIDVGRERVPVYQPRSGLSSLETRRVNRASADQRRGRAGREAEGFCYRLWSQETVLAAHREPEILQSDLAQLVFELARWGVSDPAALQWMDMPPSAALSAGRQLLAVLGLTEETGRLTSSGQQCSRWPTHPRLAVMLEYARQHPACLPLACWLIAWLEEQPGSADMDLASMMADSIGHAQIHPRWQQAARQWARRLHCVLDVNASDIPEQLAQLLLCAYPDRIALAQSGTQSGPPSEGTGGALGGVPGKGLFKLISGGQIRVAPEHALASTPLMIVVDLDAKATQGKVFSAARLSPALLEQRFPAAREWQDHVSWDERLLRLVAEQIRVLALGGHQLILERRPHPLGSAALPAALRQQALIQALQQRGRVVWSDEDQQLLGRLRLLNRTLGAPWPEVSEHSLLASLDQWLAPHLADMHRLDQVERLPLARLFLDSLDWRLQQQLDRLCPTHLSVPSGSSIRLDYRGDEPVLAVKLQEMFGQRSTPSVLEGRVPVLIHLLSPARRPVQITRDLAGFWSSSYFEVRKDLRGRYPRHPWPDDPLQAVATARAKPRS